MINRLIELSLKNRFIVVALYIGLAGWGWWALGATPIDATTPEIAETLSIAGTPEECVAKLKEIEAAGVNHMILAITDATLVKTFMGRDIEGVADVDTQLRLIHDRIMPEFS